MASDESRGMVAAPRLSPMLKWYGAKNRAVDVIAPVILRAAAEKWQPNGGAGLPFDTWAELGAGSAAVTFEAYNRLGERALDAAWLLTDPAPGWANFMRVSRESLNCYLQAAHDLATFDGLYEPHPMGAYSPAQAAQFAAWRESLSQEVTREAARLVEGSSLQAAVLYWLVNRRGFNGQMRVGSGRKRASWDSKGRKAQGPIRFTLPKSAYGTQGPPKGPSAAEPLKAWHAHGQHFDVTANTYAEELPRLTEAARRGRRVVVYIDPPYYKWVDDVSAEYVKTAAELEVEAERELARKRSGKKARPVKAPQAGWVSTFAEYTPEGFPIWMWEELRELVVQFVEAGGLVAVSGHYTTASWWTDTGVFWGAAGEDDAAEAGLVLRPGEHHPMVAKPRELLAGHIEMPSRGGAGTERRFIRADFFGIAGLGGRGLTLPVRQWVAGKEHRGLTSRHPWLVDRR